MSLDLALDLHVLARLQRFETDEQKACLASIQAAMARSPFPVKLHVCPTVSGHLGRARADAYARGQAPYVTFVDDDDLLEPYALEVLYATLQRAPDAVFPKERYLWPDGSTTVGLQRHHLVTFRREYLIDHRRWTHAGDQAQIRSLELLDLVDLPDTLYTYRRKEKSGGTSLRDRYPKQLLEARIFADQRKHDFLAQKQARVATEKTSAH